ncbi:hypothetical protein Q5738_18680 [Citrobacter werkmanii]|uniref:hypothetical protein n=1 Tax=Citrobacter werkmanii TaxID=67827 RepID=UPI0027247493|nr:hypothetical protein [Citrobacter werkmanii]MDO8235586.1 hypothetical protein [Citrobacter werkmanii]
MNNTEFIGVKVFSIYSESVLFALISSYLHLDFRKITGVIYRGFISAMRRCANTCASLITARAAEPEEPELMKSLRAVEKLSARKQKQVLEFIGVIAGKGLRV